MDKELKFKIDNTVLNIALHQFTDDKDLNIQIIEEYRQALHELCPLQSQPIDRVRWVPIEKVQANDYNPNSVAGKEMGLLYTSIKHDGYTQPVVTIYDEKIDKYIIVDGFHRYFTCKSKADILERNHGMLPIVVIQKDINDRMASTVRHNRARGEHSINGMSHMVYEMLKNGWADHDICNELGMEPEELLKLKHITGFSKLFKDKEFTQSWKSKEMIQIEKKEGLLNQES
ncbi:IbrB-like domain-containing protein [Flavobacterium sedimenticola]|uniref:ParB/RepB/Spo0J family partition protein n=1 Tax=Flavobacterium sedimenticola TaxID=3043286 RepID=A0ABT6XMN2_9FLAO|nr:ParB/RepB/Spo0J family partition protein [Flavobacterium sedimenticola]MDI9256336.1 ParB/RepB/Spo0J family partition protein [Flavobacterium sedimenticola]